MRVMSAAQVERANEAGGLVELWSFDGAKAERSRLPRR
jgi:hypothetical protein